MPGANDEVRGGKGRKHSVRSDAAPRARGVTRGERRDGRAKRYGATSARDGVSPPPARHRRAGIGDAPEARARPSRRKRANVDYDSVVISLLRAFGCLTRRRRVATLLLEERPLGAPYLLTRPTSTTPRPRLSSTTRPRSRTRDPPHQPRPPPRPPRLRRRLRGVALRPKHPRAYVCPILRARPAPETSSPRRRGCGLGRLGMDGTRGTVAPGALGLASRRGNPEPTPTAAIVAASSASARRSRRRRRRRRRSHRRRRGAHGGALVRASASVPGAQLADGALDLRSHLVGQRGRGRRGGDCRGFRRDRHGEMARAQRFERARARTRVEVAFDARRGRRAERAVGARPFRTRGCPPAKTSTRERKRHVRRDGRGSRWTPSLPRRHRHGCLLPNIRVKLKREMIPEFKERWGILAARPRNEPETLSTNSARATSDTS